MLCLVIFAGCTQQMAPPSNPDDRFISDDLNNSESNISKISKSLLLAVIEKVPINNPNVDSPSNPKDNYSKEDISSGTESNSTDEKNDNSKPKKKDKK